MSDGTQLQVTPKTGRPSKYDPSYPDLGYKLCLLGATDQDLADFFEVAASTVYEWKNEHPEFAERIRTGKRIADMHIAHKLFQRAEGAEWVEEQPFKLKREIFDDSGKKVATQEEVVTVPVRKAAPPDTTAIIFWLKNRDPKSWRDKQDHEHTGKDGAALLNEITVTVVRALPEPLPAIENKADIDAR